MGIYQTVTGAERSLYLNLAARHNAETDAALRYEIYQEGSRFLAEIGARLGSVSAGMLIADADMALPDDGRPACAGMYLDMIGG
jgi:hypothetical protein